MLFFLKCLDDDDARLPDLIRDEIGSRDWFVYRDSLNAQASKWVQQEIELAKAKEDKVYEDVDLDQELEPQLYKLDRLLKRVTIFLSYSRQDHEIAERIRRVFLKHDYSVWTGSEITSGSTWQNVIRSAIDEAATRGFVVVLLSPAYLTSEYGYYEINYSLELASKSKKSNIIPVIIEPFAHNEVLPLSLPSIQWFDLTIGQFDEDADGLIRSLKIREMG